MHYRRASSGTVARPQPSSVRPPVLVSALPLLQLIKRLLNRHRGHSGAHQSPVRGLTDLTPSAVPLTPGWTDGHVSVARLSCDAAAAASAADDPEEAGWRRSLINVTKTKTFLQTVSNCRLPSVV